MIELTITHIIYVNEYNEKIEDELKFDNDGNLLNHKNYLDYSSRHIDNLRFDTYEKAEKFFKENYEDLMINFEHWIQEDENGRIEYVIWERRKDFNMDLDIMFEEVKNYEL